MQYFDKAFVNKTRRAYDLAKCQVMLPNDTASHSTGLVTSRHFSITAMKNSVTAYTGIEFIIYVNVFHCDNFSYIFNVQCWTRGTALEERSAALADV